jgi:hypothetical protein
MLFLKVTKSVRGFFKRTGWLVAEVVLVFLGMYGAFLLERMHDEEMDLLRKKQILQALVDEFENYEEELSSASHSLDEGYGIPFFTAYSSGEKPFPSPIPFGGMGSVNTGIWEAMLQSGGIEVLEVEMIQEVQGFFKKLQDLLDLYSRFERLTENLILPMMDESVEYFYESNSTELRNKYKWYVNSLFTVGMTLRELSAQAGNTKELLSKEYQKTFNDLLPEEDEVLTIPTSEKEDDSSTNFESNSISEEGEDLVLIQTFEDELLKTLILFSKASENFDDNYAIPFFTSYSNGECPVPFSFTFPYLPEGTLDNMKALITDLESLNYSQESISSESLQEYLINTIQLLDSIKEFELKSSSLFNEDRSGNLSFYEENSTALSSDYEWFPNELFTIGTALRSVSEESLRLLDNFPSDE